ncbi:putative translation factor (SUA5) [Xenococcus sp. PCC 7305]|uniref:L-threonylcarbamoyladenylate synthase n=1 Tax=Xenococcus sp. PCC 7305 TaxID=102125 RepID=UPI0002AC7F68|nr:L-threonylcarbamoyladenylate synthase [Xenococcus sp. PCC 7305]ELS04185.1 putative translation factor (SUA5) [Xenococcus sp. PCC 7305]
MLNELLAGKVISFPTDTVPALATKPEFAQALFDIKKRPPTKPLILMGAAITDLLPYISGTPKELQLWQDLATQYFPGALTLVLPASDIVPPQMNPTNSQTIGIRIPDSSIALSILKQTGVLATTSANLSGQDPLLSMGEIAEAFPEVVVYSAQELDPQKPMGSGLPSTVVQWQNHNWQILRQGALKLSRIKND